MRKFETNKIGNKFYQKVGALFFAIAMADGSIHNKEREKLKSLIRDKWLLLDDIEDEFGSDAAFQIEIVFDWYTENERKSRECFNSFEEFYREHTAIFSNKIKTLIHETANAIAYSFSGKNKSELVMLGNLQLLFNS
ncbi:hypothetical protein [Aurantibacter sp.]|uniref:hypothetical protein n=1 Tax=Aurantibacter sp. TaxID=2807103 RepID=UPI003265A466